MKKLRIYVDTSVIGGCFDHEFEKPGWPPKFPHLWPLENPPPDGCF